MKKVATRFAPSPTGALHIGGVRTALFNWLYSKNQKGNFYLRIEDTDKERSKEKYKDQIIQSLKWLGINHDGEEYIQSKKINDHIKVANELLKNGYAYRCYCSNEEIEEQKKRAKQKKIPYVYDRKWRNKDEKEAPKDIKPVLRFKSKIEGTSLLKDLVQGNVEIENNTIEDFIILRNDGTPTYNLSASVDDHQMNMTHIIRGDDHKINTFKQIQIYEAMKWELPSFAHIPLIHTIEGKKLSKRDQASTLDDYSKIGIMPNALRNYLLRLGWSFKDKEIFTLEESIKYFNLEGIGKSPSKLDMSRILSINEHYIKNMDENDLFNQLVNYCQTFKNEIDRKKKEKIKNSLGILKNKAKTLEDIYNNCKYIVNDEVIFNKEDLALIDAKAKKIISEFHTEFKKINEINRENLEPIIQNLIKSNETNFKGVGQPLRIALTGSKFGPGIYDIIISLGKDDVEKRLTDKAISQN
jgi:glutamyl-tRNA synthetase